MSDREDFELGIWELHKYVYGVRPRGYNFSEMSVNELKDMHAHLVVLADEEEIRQEAEKNACIEIFEYTVAETIKSGAKDRETAIRWLREAEQDRQLEGDDGYFEYCNGLPYGYLLMTREAT